MSTPLTQAVSISAPDPDHRRVAVAASHVSKAFRLPQERHTTVKAQLLHPFAHGRTSLLPALRGVSFEVKRGETFGIVGRNGSGKSTLLRCLARVYRVDAGRIAVAGRVAPLIELGTGLNDELTARDNVVLSLVLLGLTPAEARSRVDRVLAFAELDQFVDVKLKNFSSGMILRLGFAVTVGADADILLFDEVLKVGDIAFQDKTARHFDRLKAEGKTLLLVSHDMGAIERHCNRVLLLDAGRIVDVGAPDEIARMYYERNAPAGTIGAEPDPNRTWTSATSRPGETPGPRSGAPTVGGDPRRLLTITRLLATAEFKLKYLDAVLSYLWVLISPLAFFGILYFIFTRVGRFNHGVEHYPLYLLSALVLWMFFAQATGNAIRCLVESQQLLRRVSFPHVAIPLSVVAMAFFDLCVNSLATLVFVLAAGVRPRLSWLEVVPLIALLSMLVSGIALLLSALYVRYRDVDHIWIIVRQLLFYGSGVFFVVTSLSASFRPIILANPLTAVFTQIRHAVFDPHAPTVATAAGGTAHAIIPLAVVCITFALGFWAFNRESPTVAENL